MQSRVGRSTLRSVQQDAVWLLEQRGPEQVGLLQNKHDVGSLQSTTTKCHDSATTKPQTILAPATGCRISNDVNLVRRLQVYKVRGLESC